MRCDLTSPKAMANRHLPLTVREIRKRDVPSVFDLKEPGLSPAGISDRVHQWHLLESGVKTCYLAMTSDDRPFGMAWLVGRSENRLIREYFKGAVADLGDDEMLLEGVLELEPYAGCDVIEALCAGLKDVAAASGARRLIAYVDERNVPALEALSWLGFVPQLLRRERRRLGRHQVAITPLPEEARYLLERGMSIPVRSAS